MDYSRRAYPFYAPLHSGYLPYSERPTLHPRQIGDPYSQYQYAPPRRCYPRHRHPISCSTCSSSDHRGLWSRFKSSIGINSSSTSYSSSAKEYPGVKRRFKKWRHQSNNWDSDGTSIRQALRGRIIRKIEGSDKINREDAIREATEQKFGQWGLGVHDQYVGWKDWWNGTKYKGSKKWSKTPHRPGSVSSRSVGTGRVSFASASDRAENARSARPEKSDRLTRGIWSKTFGRNGKSEWSDKGSTYEGSEEEVPDPIGYRMSNITSNRRPQSQTGQRSSHGHFLGSSRYESNSSDDDEPRSNFGSRRDRFHRFSSDCSIRPADSEYDGDDDNDDEYDSLYSRIPSAKGSIPRTHQRATSLPTRQGYSPHPRAVKFGHSQVASGRRSRQKEDENSSDEEGEFSAVPTI